MTNESRKELDLRILMLLSSLETAMFVSKVHWPDHTLDQLNDIVEQLKAKVLG